jgi:hypothetical protein
MIGDPLNVEEDGTSIVVTMPGTDFSATYQKQSGSLQLLESRIAANTGSGRDNRLSSTGVSVRSRQGAGTRLD